jgi:alkylation response protein AidB-like acyl-CoA dehydrogenase
MDFSFTEEQAAVGETAATLFNGLVDPARVTAAEQSADGVDRELWQQLAAADLLGLAVPEVYGGAGYGLVELCQLLEVQGAVVAPVPLWATLVLGALPLARFGTPMQQRRWLPRVVSGEAMLTAALTASAQSSSGLPSIEATPHVGGWVLQGVELAVPQAHLAERIVVPARSPDGRVLIALVDPTSPGVTLERAATTDRAIHPHLHLSHVSVLNEDIMVDRQGGRAALAVMLTAATIALCALQVGVCEAALRQTADYLNRRTQFNRTLGSFQGAMLKVGDAAIDLEAMRVTLWRAAWLFDDDRDATDAAAVAKWQASERGQRIVHATQHLHGGVGADITYPIHRYFLWGKQIELLLGGPSRQLANLGERIADRARAAASTADASAGTRARA